MDLFQRPRGRRSKKNVASLLKFALTFLTVILVLIFAFQSYLKNSIWKAALQSIQGYDFEKAARAKYPVILIATPMKNSIEHIWHYFHMLDTLSYPKMSIRLAILVSDSNDGTYKRALELSTDRQSSWSKSKRFRSVHVFKKDFHPDELGLDKEWSNIGKARHSFEFQIERRKILAKSRSWLLSSSLAPDVERVLWMDVDIVDYEKDLIETLLAYEKSSQSDVIVPNCMWRTYNEMGPYDRNNWIETNESIAMKATLSKDDILFEGYQDKLPTYRRNMADMYPPDESTSTTVELDSVGGCMALVKSSFHRFGASFPFVPYDHQLETEGFSQIVKAMGGKLVGLPKYYVYHGLYG